MTIRFVQLPFFLLFLVSCATYQGKVREARDHMAAGRSQAAVALLEPLSKEQGSDQLVYLFDYATALQAAGRYRESSEQYQLADRMSDAKDYFSVSKFAGSLLLSEGVTQYKGQDYERLFINVMASINYVMMNDRESALVEIRRLNDKLEYFRLEQKKEYDKSTMSMYLGAMLWEADKNWDSAYIDYERVFKRNVATQFIKEDLVRAALKSRRKDKADQWKKEFQIQPKSEWSDKEYGEVILLYMQGWGPRKVERPRVATAFGFVSPGFPMLVKVPAYSVKAKLTLMGGGSGPVMHQSQTELIYSVEDAAIKALEAEFAPLIAKRIAAYIAKKQVSNQVAKKDEGLGALVNLAMQIADRADLRQWSTLPATFQVARIFLPMGKYKLKIEGLSADGNTTGEYHENEIEIKSQQKTFVSWRTYK